MIYLNLMTSQNIFSTVVERFNEGGFVIMSLILICFILAMLFLVLAFKKLTSNPLQSNKMKSLVVEFSLLGLVIGFFGSILGLITAFDAIGGVGNISTEIFAGGLKVSFLSTLFGTLTFIISRIGVLTLTWKQKIND
jgi:divalent metal cation (Fe/Co/Zn/Cd) transporter